MPNMNESQIEWFNDLSTRYMKYNVSLYNYKGIDMSNVEFGEVDFSLKVTKEETEHRYIILSYCGDEKKNMILTVHFIRHFHCLEHLAIVF